MKTPPQSEFNDAERVAALRRYEILDTPREDTFDRVSALAARIFETPVAGVSLVDHDRVWFKSIYGVDLQEIDREPGLCSSAILQESGIYLIRDALHDPRTAQHPFVVGPFGLRFYASAVLRTPEGLAIGTLFILDKKPRDLSATQQATFCDLAHLVIAQIEHRAALRRLVRAESELHHFEQKNHRSQKLEHLGLMAGGVAHDFRNLLTALRGHCDLALDSVQAQDQAGLTLHLRNLNTVTINAQRRCEDLLRHDQAPPLRECDLNRLILDLKRILRPLLAPGVDIRLELTPELPPLLAAPEQLMQSLMNLAINANEAIDGKGSIFIRTRIADAPRTDGSGIICMGSRDAGRYVEIIVEDDGCGIEPAYLHRVFDPFFTTKHHGRGLGLASILATVRMLDGSLFLCSQSGEGAQFRLVLPARASHVSGKLPTSYGSALSQIEQQHFMSTNIAKPSNIAILFVDDEVSICSLAEKVLTHAGYRVFTALDADAALAIAKREPDIACAVIDVSMPGRDGWDSARELLSLRPTLAVIIASGWRSDANECDLNIPGVVARLNKPYLAEQLRTAVRDAIARFCADSQAAEANVETEQFPCSDSP